MSKKLWSTEEIAIEETKKSLDDFKALNDAFREIMQGRGIEQASRIFGHSLVNSIYKLCELALDLVCWEYVSHNGKYKFPEFKEVADLKKDFGFPVPVMGRVAANSIINIKDECNKSFDINSELLYALLKVAMDFVIEMSMIASKNCEHINNIIGCLEKLSQNFNHYMH